VIGLKSVGQLGHPVEVEAPMTGFNQANKAGADLDQVGQLLVGEL
jgi:hypothetical protein